MSQVVLTASNVSKKYAIYHEKQDGYGTLVETLARSAKRLTSKISRREIAASHSTYEEFWALKDISLEVHLGDRIGIIGRNGAGKSTLLKLFSRITEPTTGEIKIRGRIASLLEVGIGFHPELTGRENIFLNGAILGMTKKEIKQKFDEIVSFSEIEQFLDTPMKRYSSGMYTRLGFAVAAHLDPDILIVDEVLAVGDIQFQEKCLKKLNDLGSHGRTILFVSHDVGSILTLCNKGVFLEKGKIAFQGDLEECVNAYMRTCRMNGLCWEGNEGDEHIRFLRASLSTHTPKEFFYQDDMIQCDIEYEILKPNPDIVLGIGVWNQRNQLLARSQLADGTLPFDAFTTPGKHSLSFYLHGAFLHEGEYILKWDCTLHNRKNILHDAVSLKLPIYAQNKNTRFSHNTSKEGVALGNQWKKGSI